MASAGISQFWSQSKVTHGTIGCALLRGVDWWWSAIGNVADDDVYWPKPRVVAQRFQLIYGQLIRGCCRGRLGGWNDARIWWSRWWVVVGL